MKPERGGQYSARCDLGGMVRSRQDKKTALAKGRKQESKLQ